MEWYVWAILIAAWLTVSVWLAGEFESVARDKGYDDSRYFWISLLFGFMGWALVIALPDRKMNETLKTIAEKLNNQSEGQKEAPKKARPFAAIEKARPRPEPEKAPATTGAPDGNAPTGDAAIQAVVPLLGEKEDTVFCPLCGEMQRAGRNVCWNCGVKFLDPFTEEE